MDPIQGTDRAESRIPTPAAQLSGTAAARPRVDVGAVSHPGKIRINNEDHFLVARFGRSLEPLLTNLPDDLVPSAHVLTGYGLLVADGLGGMPAGEVASSSAIHALVDMVMSTPDWMMTGDKPCVDIMMERMTRRFQEIDEILTRMARADPSLRGMATTMTLVASLGMFLVVVHIGDSRAYLLRQGRLQKLTRDMTRAQEMVDAGELTPAVAARHRLRHILTQCLGGSGHAEVQIETLTLEEGDRLLLCTDGLTDMLKENDLVQVLSLAGSAQQTCQALVDLALKRGGLDNVTALLANYQPAYDGGK